MADGGSSLVTPKSPVLLFDCNEAIKLSIMFYSDLTVKPTPWNHQSKLVGSYWMSIDAEEQQTVFVGRIWLVKKTGRKNMQESSPETGSYIRRQTSSAVFSRQLHPSLQSHPPLLLRLPLLWLQLNVGHIYDIIVLSSKANRETRLSAAIHREPPETHARCEQGHRHLWVTWH